MSHQSKYRVKVLEEERLKRNAAHRKWYAQHPITLERRKRKKEYDKEYCARPEVIARRKIYDATPESKIRRKRAELRKYNISLEQYNEMFILQSGRDAITGLPLVSRREISHPSLPFATVDHDHVSGKFRGLLNNNINRALGLFKENPVWLRAAADYIEKHREAPCPL